MAKLYSIIIILLFILSSQSSAQNLKKTKKVNEYILNGYRYQRDVSTMKEGYNTYQGFYAIKDHIVSGKLNFLSVTYGTTMSNYQTGGGTITHYYLQKDGVEKYLHEVFFKSKPKKSFLNISKAALAEAFEDDPNLLEKVNVLQKLRKKDVTAFVNEYNLNHREVAIINKVLAP